MNFDRIDNKESDYMSIHIEAKKGTYQGYHQNSQGVYMLTGSTWLYDLFGVNNTTIAKTNNKIIIRIN